MDQWQNEIQEHDNQEALRAIQSVRDNQLADLFALWFGLACERHPDVMKTAIGKLFDITAVEETTKRTMTSLEGVLEQARKVHKRYADAIHLQEKRISDTEERIAKCEAYLDRMDQRLHPTRKK